MAVYSRTSANVNSTYYILKDSNDSVATLLDSTGAVIARESFNAYGTRRNPGTWSGQVSATGLDTSFNISRQGYTWQTALGYTSLNHMNARVQDSATGVFLSADSLISDPGYTQSYNRYGYVNNNPLSYNDPSGHCPSNNGTTPPDNGTPPSNEPPSDDDGPGYELEEVVVTAELRLVNMMGLLESQGEGWGNNGDYNYNFGAPANDPTPQTEKPQDPCGGVITNYPNGTGILAVPVPGTGQGNPGFGIRPGGHWGLDLASAAHADVVAAGSGIIIRQDFANLSGYGGQVIIDHRNGVFTQYGHLESFSLSLGVKVAAGDVIGRTAVPGVKPGAGNLGVGMSPHVHFEVRLGSPLAHSAGGNPINPQLCLKGK